MATDIKTDELPLATSINDDAYLIKQDFKGNTTLITAEDLVNYLCAQAAQLKVVEPADDTAFIATEKGATTVSQLSLADLINCIKVLLKNIPIVDTLLDSMSLLCSTGEDVSALSIKNFDQYLSAQSIGGVEYADKLDPALNSSKGDAAYKIQYFYDYMPRPVLDKTFFVKYPERGETVTDGSSTFYLYNAVVPNATNNSNQEYFYMARGMTASIHSFGATPEAVSGYPRKVGLKMGIATAGTKIPIGLSYYDEWSSENKDYEAIPQCFWALPTEK